MAEVASDLYQTVERTVGGMGYRLVDVERLGGGLLRVSLDAEKGIGLEDCERVSRQLSHLFAVEDIDYQRLEVSSPGLDRRLRSFEDFARFVGKEINVHLYAPSAAAGGRKRLRGRLLQLFGGEGEERLQLQLTADEAEASGAAKRDRRSQKHRTSAEVSAAVVEVDVGGYRQSAAGTGIGFSPGAYSGRDGAHRNGHDKQFGERTT